MPCGRRRRGVGAILKHYQVKSADPFVGGPPLYDDMTLIVARDR